MSEIWTLYQLMVPLYLKQCAYLCVHIIVFQDSHDDVVVSMVCNDDFLFTSSKSNIKVWELNTLKLKHVISGLHHWVRALAVNYGRVSNITTIINIKYLLNIIFYFCCKSICNVN